MNVVEIQMYLIVLSSALADSHPANPASLGGSVAVPHLVGRRPHCFHKLHESLVKWMRVDFPEIPHE
jgi:hypothetical protein